MTLPLFAPRTPERLSRTFASTLTVMPINKKSSKRHKAKQNHSNPLSRTLTGRQKQTVELIMTGATNTDISREMNISIETVKRHLSTVYDKCGVNTRLELALRYGLNDEIAKNRLDFVDQINTKDARIKELEAENAVLCKRIQKLIGE